MKILSICSSKKGMAAGGGGGAIRSAPGQYLVCQSHHLYKTVMVLSGRDLPTGGGPQAKLNSWSFLRDKLVSVCLQILVVHSSGVTRGGGGGGWGHTIGPPLPHPHLTFDCAEKSLRCRPLAPRPDEGLPPPEKKRRKKRLSYATGP